MSENGSSTTKQSLRLSIDYRLVSIALLLVVCGMLALWRPWSAPATNDRTIEVTGEATVSATPDKYVFNPSYVVKDADRAKANSAAAAKSQELVTALKKLGVADKDIKTNIVNYDKLYAPESESNGQYQYNVTLTISANDKDMAQKIQDYLVASAAEGMVTPTVTFSETKRRELESKARNDATKDARAKADQSAKNLGFKVGKVKAVNDGAGFDGVMPMAASGSAAMSRDIATTTLEAPSAPVQPGENDLNYSVTVTYYLR